MVSTFTEIKMVNYWTEVLKMISYKFSVIDAHAFDLLRITFLQLFMLHVSGGGSSHTQN